MAAEPEDPQETPQCYMESMFLEIAQNTQDPCELFRELVSNSYDAGATKLGLCCLPSAKGFAFFDNGHGIHKEAGASGVSPYKAFFSIGAPSKRKGAGTIGYKCQGSKLALNSSGHFIMITRSVHEKSGKDWPWRFIQLHDPRQHIMSSSPVRSTLKSYDEVLQAVARIFRPPQRDAAYLLENVLPGFLSTTDTGTVIISTGFANEELVELLSAAETKGRTPTFTFKPPNRAHLNARTTRWQTTMHLAPYSMTDEDTSDTDYLFNYLRFKTRHGSPLYYQDGRGFASAGLPGMTNFSRDLNRPVMWIMQRDSNAAPNTSGTTTYRLAEVPLGLPYLLKSGGPNNDEADVPGMDPLHLRSHAEAEFQARYTGQLEVAGNTYTVLMVVDGLKRRKAEYKALNCTRHDEGARKIPISDFSGVLIYTDGVYVAGFPALFQRGRSLLGSDETCQLLGEPDATQHYMMIINGPFELNANRSAVANTSVMYTPTFKDKLKKLIRTWMADPNDTLKKLVQYMRRDKLPASVAHAANERRDKLRDQELFTVGDAAGLGEAVFVAPTVGQESGVSGLYYLFASRVTPESPVRDEAVRPWWPVPLTSSGGAGVDSLGLPHPVYWALQPGEFLGNNVCGIEFKAMFPPRDGRGRLQLNHPFEDMEYLICWDYLDPVKGPAQVNGKTIFDRRKNIGSVLVPETKDHLRTYNIPSVLKDTVLIIENIQYTDEATELYGKYMLKPDENKHFVRVILLKKLIDKTWGYNVTRHRKQPPSDGNKRGAAGGGGAGRKPSKKKK